jgi:hypothetical protein
MVPLPPRKNAFAVKINNNNNKNRKDLPEAKHSSMDRVVVCRRSNLCYHMTAEVVLSSSTTMMIIDYDIHVFLTLS